MGSGVSRDAFEDQRRLIARDRPLTIFDVGAHVGQTSMKYVTLFPGSAVYAFEPYPASFAHLKYVASLVDDIHPVMAALGDADGEKSFSFNTFDQTNSLLPVDAGVGKTWGEGVVEGAGSCPVECMTLDRFVADRKIDYIDILKLDTQGAEGMVLDGAKRTLANGAVGMVYSEIITMPTYVGQVGLAGLLAHLEPYGFKLYCLYNVSTADSGQIRQMDGLFVQDSRRYAVTPTGLSA
jgi:FkbM family methyltransferase